MLFKDHFQAQLNKRIMECGACKMKDNPGPVLGYGGQDADVMFIGDIAKESDMIHGVPFTGIAKEKFTESLKGTDLKKGEYYITYFIKHTITDGSRPDGSYNKPCGDILLEEIELINPRIICSMGYYVTKFLMQAYAMEEYNKSMKSLHGNGYIIPAKVSYKSRYTKRLDDRPKRYLIPTWSPAVENVIQNHEMKTDVMIIKSVRNLGILLWE